MPLGRRSGELQLWRSYSREEIPALFGFEFSTAIWNAGFVKRPGHIFLLVTLDKSGHGSEFQYKDHFISRSEFEWQSQNRTAQDERGWPGYPKSRGARFRRPPVRAWREENGARRRRTVRLLW